MQALEKSKYEQSLETVRHFIAIAEKELELYHRHIALYGDPAQRNPNTISSGASEASEGTGEAKKAFAIDNTSDESLATEDDDEDEDNGDADHHMSLFLSESSTDTDDSSTELDSSDEDS